MLAKFHQDGQPVGQKSSNKKTIKHIRKYKRKGGFRKTLASFEMMLANSKIFVTQKRIKNIHFRICSKTADIKVSSPIYINRSELRKYITQKISWLKEQQGKVKLDLKSSQPNFIAGEKIYFLGNPYVIRITNDNEDINSDEVIRFLKSEKVALIKATSLSDKNKITNALDKFYKKELQEILLKSFQHWQNLMQLNCKKIKIRKMRSRWGSCNIQSKEITINLELIKKPYESIEYVVVHELAHLIEASHNKRFVAVMDRYLPNWRNTRSYLNGKTD